MEMSAMDMSSYAMSSSSMPSMSSASSMAMTSMPMPSVTMSSSSSLLMTMMTSTATSGSGGMSGMSGMDMDNSSDTNSSMNMGMNYYLTPTYRSYPVLFQHLSANSEGKAFGIFLLIVVAAFVYKFLLFVSWCLEVHWFKRWNKSNKYSTLQVDRSSNKDADGMDYYTDETFHIQTLPRIPNFMFDVFSPSLIDLFHDFIRALLTFTSTMIIYMLMLATMSFVLTYVFAVITGLSLAEVFFNRCKICMLKRWDIQREIKRTTTCPGAGNCQCGRHTLTDDEIATASSNDQSTQIQGQTNEEKSCCLPAKKPVEPSCCCTEKSKENERRIETDILENLKLQEQAGNMDSNLMPAEKFK